MPGLVEEMYSANRWKGLVLCLSSLVCGPWGDRGPVSLGCWYISAFRQGQTLLECETGAKRQASEHYSPNRGGLPPAPSIQTQGP